MHMEHARGAMHRNPDAIRKSPQARAKSRISKPYAPAGLPWYSDAQAPGQGAAIASARGPGYAHRQWAGNTTIDFALNSTQACPSNKNMINRRIFMCDGANSVPLSHSMQLFDVHV